MVAPARPTKCKPADLNSMASGAFPLRQRAPEARRIAEEARRGPDRVHARGGKPAIARRAANPPHGLLVAGRDSEVHPCVFALCFWPPFLVV
jgi:hypothetical protein